MKIPRWFARSTRYTRRIRTIAVIGLSANMALSPAVITAAATTSDVAVTTRVIEGPAGTGLKLEVTPGDLENVTAGQLIKLKFSGLKPGQNVNVGTCPGGIREELERLDGITFTCTAQLSTGLAATLDADQQGPGYSTLQQSRYAQPDGTLSIDFLVGRGKSLSTTNYFYNDFTNSEPFYFDCDEDDPCVMGWSINKATGFGNSWFDMSSLVIAPKDRELDQSGCTGLGANTLTGTGSERLQGMFSALNKGFCSETPGPIPVSYIADGESGNLSKIGAGENLAFAGSPLVSEIKPANTLAIPIAINAVGLAQWGGQSAASNTPGQIAGSAYPIPPLAVTPADLAGIVLHNYPSDTRGLDPADRASANPVAGNLASRANNGEVLNNFDPTLFGLPFNPAPTVTYSVGPDSTAIALSDYLEMKSASNWKFADHPANVALDRANKPVGRVTSFDSLKDSGVGETGPQLTSQVSSAGGLFTALFNKDISEFYRDCPVTNLLDTETRKILSKGCVRFGVMDTATAAAMQLSLTQLGEGSTFTAPTVDSLTKASAGNLNSAGYFESTDQTAYPLTYLEYAVVPKAPLLDESCKPLVAQQAALSAFLKYATSTGQSGLPAGFAPLTADLKTQAASIITQLGTGTPTGPCAPKKPTTTPPKSPAGTDSSPSGVPPAGTNNPADPAGTSNGAGPAAPGAGPAGSAAAANVSAESTKALAAVEKISAQGPGFAGAGPLSATKALIGILLLVALTSGAAVLGGHGPAALWARISGRVR